MDGYNLYEPKPSKNVPGIISFVFAMISLVSELLVYCGSGIAILCALTYVGVVISAVIEAVAIPISLIIPLFIIAGLSLGRVGVNLKNKPKGLARAGLIINAILLGLQVLGVIVFVVIAILATVFGVGTAFFALLMSVFSADSMQNLQMY